MSQCTLFAPLGQKRVAQSRACESSVSSTGGVPNSYESGREETNKSKYRACLPCTLVAVLTICVQPAQAERLVLVAGGGEKGDGAPATEARLHSPFGVDFDSSRAMFIAELEGGHVHRVDPQGIFTTIAGTGEKGDAGDGGPAKSAVFNGMHSLAVAPTGDVFIADTWNNRVRKIDPRSGQITAFAGTGKKAYAGDGGPAVKADCGGIYCVAFSPDAKTLYLADLDNRRIRAVDMTSGTIRLIAGNGAPGVPADGAAAREAPLVDPRAVAADRNGNVYVLERGGHALRVVDREGRIRTVAGTGKAGPADDSGLALTATLRGPKHLCIDRDGSVIIADTDNHVIRRYLPAKGTLVKIAGTGKAGSAGVGGPPETVELNQPHGVHVDRDGTLFIVDSLNNRVLKMVK